MSLWRCEICYHEFPFVPPLGEDGKPIKTRPSECPKCGVPDSGACGEVTLDPCET